MKIAVTDENGKVLNDWDLSSLLAVVGNAKSKVVNYILEQAIKKDGLIIISQRQIAKEIGVAYTTVTETMKHLQEEKIIRKIQYGCYALNGVWKENN